MEPLIVHEGSDIEVVLDRAWPGPLEAWQYQCPACGKGTNVLVVHSLCDRQEWACPACYNKGITTAMILTSTLDLDPDEPSWTPQDQWNRGDAWYNRIKFRWNNVLFPAMKRAWRRLTSWIEDLTHHVGWIRERRMARRRRKALEFLGP